MTKYGIQALAGALLATFAIGCPGPTIEAVEESSVILATPEDGAIQIELPSQPMRPQEQSGKILLRNEGQADLLITGVEWIARPPRLYVETPLPGGASREDVASCDTDCSKPICLQAVAGDVCVTTGPPTENITVRPAASEQLTFFLAPGSGGLDCPAPPADTPPEYADDSYCGAIRVTTNARNNDGTSSVVDGTVTVYFTRGNQSGEIELTETFMEFAGVAPNFSERRTFAVQNRSTSEPLTITSVVPDINAQFFDIQSDGGLSGEIAPGGLKTYTLQVSIPPGTDPGLLDFTSTVKVNSTAARVISDALLVNVTTDGGAFPRIEVDKQTLKFDAQAEQTLTLENVGEATLLLNGTRFQPSSADDFYTITVDGQPIQGNVTIPKGESKTLNIAFARPANRPDDSSVATLVLQHNDDSVGQRTRIVLLGDEGDVPLGELVPNTFALSSQAGDQPRSFAVINRGTAPLSIDSVMFNAVQGSSDEFVFNTSNLMVAPGSVEEVTFEFKPINNTPDNVSVTFMSNFIDPANEFFINLSTFDTGEMPPSPMIVPSFATSAKVGERTSFSSRGSLPAEATSSGQWVLVAKPAGSQAYVNNVGESVSFTPDVAGSYKMVLTLSTGTIDGQTSLEFTAE